MPNRSFQFNRDMRIELALACILIVFPALGVATLSRPSRRHSVWLPLCLPRRSYSARRRFIAKCLRAAMQATRVTTNRRRQDRIQAVLPVRVRGTDAYGASFEGLAHTLDLTPTGARLGAIRHQLKVLDTLTILYRQRRMEFTVVWTRLLDGKPEYQVGLQAFSQEKEPWGMSLFNSSAQPLMRASAISGAA
jgi:hypothetical protein